MTSQDTAKDIFFAGLAAVDPYRAVAAHTERLRELMVDGRYRRLNVIAVGKAAFPMMRAAADQLGKLITGGLVLTKYGHSSANVLTGSNERRANSVQGRQ